MEDRFIDRLARHLTRRAALLLGAALPAIAAATPAQPDAAATPDTAQDFGYKILWFAVRAPDPQTVAAALQATATKPANWATGLAAAYAALKSKPATAFISPAVDGWVFIASTALPYPAIEGESAKTTGRKFEQLVQRLTSNFAEVQFFGSYRVINFVAWARYVAGQPTRVFAMADEVLVNIGTQTAEEARLGFTDISGLNAQAASARLFSEGGRLPDEDDVLQLATAWSLDPSRLSERPRPAALGLLLNWPDEWAG